jgi:hypothetical protein
MNIEKTLHALMEIMSEDSKRKLLELAMAEVNQGLIAQGLKLLPVMTVEPKVTIVPPHSLVGRKKQAVTIHGKTYTTLREACHAYGLKYSTVLARRNTGKNLEQCFSRRTQAPIEDAMDQTSVVLRKQMP